MYIYYFLWLKYTISETNQKLIKYILCVKKIYDEYHLLITFDK